MNYSRSLAILLAIAAASIAAPAASAYDVPNGQPGETGVFEPPRTCGGCVPPPLPPDTDRDGLSDLEEQVGKGCRPGDKRYCHRGSLPFQPTNPSDPDTDHDGLTDGEEVLTERAEPPRNYGGRIQTGFRSNPHVWDTDGDGHSDGLEVKYTGTHPNFKDTDRDGLTDGAEGMTYRTNARNADTDGDTCKDGDEVRARTNPRIRDTTSALCQRLIRVRGGTLSTAMVEAAKTLPAAKPASSALTTPTKVVVRR